MSTYNLMQMGVQLWPRQVAVGFEKRASVFSQVGPDFRTIPRGGSAHVFGQNSLLSDLFFRVIRHVAPQVGC